MSGLRKSEILAKGILAVGHSSEASGSHIQLKRQREIMLARLVYISFQQVRAHSYWSSLQSTADSWRVPTSQAKIYRRKCRIEADVKVKGLKAEILHLELTLQD